jgi:hypothetical protein
MALEGPNRGKVNRATADRISDAAGVVVGALSERHQLWQPEPEVVPQNGFGFIVQDGSGVDIFVHISAVERAGICDLREGQKIASLP